MSAPSVVAADKFLQIGHAGVCRPHTGGWLAVVICSRPFKSFVQGGPMPIRLLLEHDHSLAPDEVAKLVKAFEGALTQLGLANREDPATTLVAKAIIEAAKGGERDPKRLRDAVIKSLST
jgi:hypothetical protein